MSASQYERQAQGKRKQLVDAEKKAGEYRSKESRKRADAMKARTAAQKTKSEASRRMKLSESERREKEAVDAGRKAAQWQTRASNYSKELATLQGKLERAAHSEAEAAERKRKREQQRADQVSAALRTEFEERATSVERLARQALRQLPAPKQEKLRVLMLGASSEGDLRVGREQKRIRQAVESALHRDQIELDVRTAATVEDLMDGVMKFRPHVVHFSGHSNEDLLVFERELDAPHKGVPTAARAFSKVMNATDSPPILVMLNSCKSAAQIDELVADVVPFAIGMADSIGDSDAISYAAIFYAAVANGQSIMSSHLMGQAALELTGLDAAELPVLAVAEDVDPSTTILVAPLE